LPELADFKPTGTIEPPLSKAAEWVNVWVVVEKQEAGSKKQEGEVARVGRVGMPADNPGHEKAVDVDYGPRYAAVPDRKFQTIDGRTSHSWYLEDSIWYDDLAYTLKGQLDRNLIPTRTRVGENDFVLKTSL
jgi:hypothetical protein